MEDYQKLKTLVDGAADDILKAAGGNKAAGTRVRKTMQDIRNVAQDIRKKILDLRKTEDAPPATELSGMPPPTLLSPSELDLSHIVADRDAIARLNAQRFEFQLLDAIVLYDAERNLAAGYHDIRADAWWTRGHIPGRPLFPGVLMIEVAAQLASYVFARRVGDGKFLGFAGVEGVKFRGLVEPPCRLLMMGTVTSARQRRFVFAAQGFVGDTMVFEAEITGMPV